LCLDPNNIFSKEKNGLDEHRISRLTIITKEVHYHEPRHVMNCQMDRVVRTTLSVKESITHPLILTRRNL
jgi:hypothetical protein